MASYIFAQGILMGLWLAFWLFAQSHLQRVYPLKGTRYLMVLMLWSGAGWALLAWLSWRYLSSSVISEGWSMESMASARYGSMGLTALMVFYLIWHTRQSWMPENELASLKAAIQPSKQPGSGRNPPKHTKAPQKKRQR